MRRLRIAVTVLVVAMMAFSVSVFASDKTTTHQPGLRLASANQPSDNIPAESGSHGTGGGDTEHAESGSGHGQDHPSLARFCPCGAAFHLPLCCCPLPYGRC